MLKNCLIFVKGGSGLIEWEQCVICVDFILRYTRIIPLVPHPSKPLQVLTPGYSYVVTVMFFLFVFVVSELDGKKRHGVRYKRCFGGNHSHFGHDLKVVEGNTSCRRLSVFRCSTGTMAYGHWQCRQLNETLAATVQCFLFDINVCYLELMLLGNFMQKLHIVKALLVQAGQLRERKKILCLNKYLENYINVCIVSIQNAHLIKLYTIIASPTRNIN